MGEKACVSKCLGLSSSQEYSLVLFWTLLFLNL